MPDRYPGSASPMPAGTHPLATARSGSGSASRTDVSSWSPEAADAPNGLHGRFGAGVGDHSTRCEEGSVVSQQDQPDRVASPFVPIMQRMQDSELLETA